MNQRNTFVFNGNTICYAIDFPNGYEEGKVYPTLLYLHGYGFVKATFEDMLLRTPVRRENLPSDQPFVCITPHCPLDSWVLRMETLCAFCEYIATQSFCDRKRFYLAGTSMGGCSAWMLLLAKKQLFSASIICCAQGPYWGAGFYVETPVLLAHGEKDDVIFAYESKVMAEKVNAVGGNVALRLYEDLDHGIWETVFKDERTYAWLLQHTK